MHLQGCFGNESAFCIRRYHPLFYHIRELLGATDLRSLFYRLGKKMAPPLVKWAVRQYRSARMERHNLRYYFRKLAYRNHLRAKHVSVAGYQLRVPDSRMGIVEELLLFGSHEPLATKAYSELLSTGDVVLDVGINLGYYMSVASRSISPGGVIFGFEPDPHLYSCAVENAQMVEAAVTVLNVAVSESVGTATFYQSEVPNCGSLFPSTWKMTEAIQVETISLDHFCRSYGITPNAIRMDIEGAELLALKGATNLLRQFKPKLFIEVHYNVLRSHGTEALLRHLCDAGYTVLLQIDRTLDWPWVSEGCRRKAKRLVTMNKLLAEVSRGTAPPVFAILAGGRIENQMRREGDILKCL